MCQLTLAIIPPLPVVGLVYLLLGLSSGVLVVMIAHSRLLFPPRMTGQVVSLVNLFAFAGTFLLQWGIGLIIAAFPMDVVGHYPPQAYRTVMLVTALGTLVAFIVDPPLTKAKGSAARSLIVGMDEVSALLGLALWPSGKLRSHNRANVRNAFIKVGAQRGACANRIGQTNASTPVWTARNTLAREPELDTFRYCHYHVLYSYR